MKVVLTRMTNASDKKAGKLIPDVTCLLSKGLKVSIEEKLSSIAVSTKKDMFARGLMDIGSIRRSSCL